jgi:hypothetical protein
LKAIKAQGNKRILENMGKGATNVGENSKSIPLICLFYEF